MNHATIDQRRVIYQARRGLKELDFYLDFYAKTYYLQSSPKQQALFAQLLTYEDPDLLLFFLDQGCPTSEIKALVHHIKALRHSHAADQATPNP